MMERMNSKEPMANKEVEMGLMQDDMSDASSLGGKARYQPVSGFSTTSVFARTPIKSTDGYEILMFQERSLFVFIFVIYCIISPLVFRYGMGSNLQAVQRPKDFKNLKNATIEIMSDWHNCITCRDVIGVTLKNITVIVTDVTSPDPNSNTPSLALFASQDLNYWYSIYKPKKFQDAYIENWDYSRFMAFNNSGVGCLGGVYHNYILACMNTLNFADELELGEKIRDPPLNDRCFQMAGICGIPCVDSTIGDDVQFFKGCDNGVLDLTYLVSNATETFDSGKFTSVWGSGINWVEWIVLATIFLDCFGNILRYVPVMSGRPTELESARSCLCEGIAVLGCCSPFVSEDEAIFLRSLIGRTATVFHTVGGRHNLQGLYFDTIVNEKRLKGEANRKHLWLSWLEFITLIARIGSEGEIDDEEEDDGFIYEEDENAKDNEDGPRKSYSRQNTNNTNTSRARAGTINQVPENLRANTNIQAASTMTYLPSKPVSGSGVGTLRVNNDEVVNFDKRMRNSEYGNRMSLSEMNHGGRQSLTGKGDGKGGLRMVNIPRNGADVGLDDEVFEEREIAPFDQEEDLVFDMADLLPLICFLDGWLEAIKDREWTFNYLKKREAIEQIFNVAPLEVYFNDTDLLMAHNCLKNLFDSFVGWIPDDEDDKIPMFPERYDEINWIVERRGLPDWTITWSLFSRARMRPFTRAQLGNPSKPYPLYECTRIKPGAIVYKKPDPDLPPHDAPENFLSARANSYIVKSFQRSAEGTDCVLAPWPPLPEDHEDYRDDTPEIVPLAEVGLVEQNRGKAGALNVYKDLLQTKASQFVAEQNIYVPVQVFMGIIDARHMLAEPEIFWNDAFPFFSRDRQSGKSAKDYGESTTTQQCIMVQYPQFFSNVNRDDFLDNKNSAYYTIWQTLRDCSKCITSSGTNAIWEITDPTFYFATTSRIEDTGTSQNYIPKYIAVHLPCFVAFGIAKQTEDYIEAVYRWSTGAVELFWSTITTPAISHYVLVGVLAFIFLLACFKASGFWYAIWVLLFLFATLQASSDKANGRRPLRRPIVSTTIVMNTMYWISNLLSTIWMVLIPIRIAFFSEVPLSESLQRSLFWGFAALIIRTPPALLTDRLVNMCRFLSLKTDDWNYSMVLWRSSQLYSCSFAYSLLSIFTGTKNAFKAKFMNKDLTMWSSFRVTEAVLKQARAKMSSSTCCSGAWWGAVGTYIKLVIKKFFAAFTMPDVLTKWFSLFLFLTQVTCIFVSMNITNANDTTAIFITLLVCGLNLLLCIDITVLLMPSITYLIGRPARPEYVFAFLGLTVVVAALVNGDTTAQEWHEIAKLDLW